jgi:hypothetical protein
MSNKEVTVNNEEGVFIKKYLEILKYTSRPSRSIFFIIFNINP